jgi:phosphonate transport system substrate-binding protein
MASSDKLIVGVVPQMEPTEIENRWGSFLKELKKVSGYSFEIRYYKSIPLFEKGLKEGELDIAFMNPYHAIMAYEWQKYRPIIHDQKALVGILVVRDGGTIAQLSDLNNQSIAFPAPNAFAASLYMRALLDKQEHIKFKPIYVKTHTNVYRNVMFGMMPAGGGVNNTFIREEPEVQRKLKILYSTKPLAAHPICLHPRIPVKVATVIEKSILEMGKNPLNKQIMDNIQIPNPVSADYFSEYFPLKKLKIEDYVVEDSK